MNVVIITADDLSLYSLGVGGCKVKATPNIDAFASDSFTLLNAHCNVPFCQPSRAVLMTGLYPQNNGAMSFDPLRHDVITLSAILKKHGYFTGLIGKLGHHMPVHVFQTDYRHQPYKGRSSRLICKSIKTFKKAAGTKNYFLLLNIHDPHRPFVTECTIDKSQIEIPNFLPDNKLMRRQFADYYSTVNRLDNTIKDVMDLLQDADLMIFTSDHGMSFPFVKGNCYHYSTNVPMIIKGKGILAKQDKDHLVSHVDLTPTILQYLGIDGTFDGTSYLQLLNTGEQSGLDYVYSQLNHMYQSPPVPMRAIISRDYCYVVNLFQTYCAGNVDGWGWTDCLAALPPKYLHMLNTRSKEEFLSRGEKPVTDAVKTEMQKILIQYMVRFKDPASREVFPIIKQSRIL